MTDDLIAQPRGDAGAFETWRAALDELLGAYGDVQRRALLLPSFTTVLRAARWRRRETRAGIRALGWRRFLGTARGEVILSMPAPRGLVDYFVGDHIGGRLRLVRRCLLLDSRLDSQEQDRLLAEIDRLLPLWPERPVLGLFYRYILPLSAIFGAVIQVFSSSTDSDVAFAWPFLMLSYAALFAALPGVAFVVKRGLMLGGAGVDALCPSLLDPPGVYSVEARVFGVLAPARREAPLDLLLLGIFLVLIATGTFPLLLLPPAGISPWVPAMLILAISLPWVILSAIAYRDRRQLGRL